MTGSNQFGGQTRYEINIGPYQYKLSGEDPSQRLETLSIVLDLDKRNPCFYNGDVTTVVLKVSFVSSILF